jgi:hypothetical protein
MAMMNEQRTRRFSHGSYQARVAAAFPQKMERNSRE